MKAKKLKFKCIKCNKEVFRINGLTDPINSICDKCIRINQNGGVASTLQGSVKELNLERTRPISERFYSTPEPYIESQDTFNKKCIQVLDTLNRVREIKQFNPTMTFLDCWLKAKGA